MQTETVKLPRHNRIIFVLSLLGLAVTTYLFYEYTQPSIACPITGIGCDVVRFSPYSTFLGITLPLWGIAFYLAMLVVSLIRTNFLSNSLLQRLQFLAIFSAVSFGAYLTYLEAFVIKAYCIWCLTSFIITVLMLGVSLFELRNLKDAKSN